MALSRRLALGLPVLLAACSAEAPAPREIRPLRYDYLNKLRLNVASLEFAPPPPPGPLDALAPVPPAEALLQMARDRLAADGSLGKAVFVVDEALISRIPDGLEGRMAVHLDVLTSEGTRAGFAQAEVTRQTVGIGSDLRGALYDLIRQMLEDMNVEFEYQVRHTLRDWLQEPAATKAVPAPVQREELRAPQGPPSRP